MRFHRLAAFIPFVLSTIPLHGQAVAGPKNSATFQAVAVKMPSGTKFVSLARVDRAKSLFIPPIANTPFSATVSLAISNGIRSDPGTNSSLIARDNAGRTYIESHSIIYSPARPLCTDTESFCNDFGTPDPTEDIVDRIYIDPVQHTYYVCTVKDHQCHALPYDMAVTQPSPDLPSAAITTHTMGQKKIDGLETLGTSKTIARYRETDETWYSSDLQINMRTKSTIGSKTVSLQVKNLKRSEPNAKLFALPARYKITSTPPPSPPEDPREQAIRERLQTILQQSH